MAGSAENRRNRGWLLGLRVDVNADKTASHAPNNVIEWARMSALLHFDTVFSNFNVAAQPEERVEHNAAD